MSLWQRRLFVAENEIRKKQQQQTALLCFMLHSSSTPPPPPSVSADPLPSPLKLHPILFPFSFFPQTNRWLCSPEYANLLCTSNSLGEDHLLKA